MFSWASTNLEAGKPRYQKFILFLRRWYRINYVKGQTPCFCGCCRQTEAALQDQTLSTAVSVSQGSCPQGKGPGPQAPPRRSWSVRRLRGTSALTQDWTAFPDTTLTRKKERTVCTVKRAPGWSTSGNRLFLLNMEERGFINLLFI